MRGHSGHGKTTSLNGTIRRRLIPILLLGMVLILLILSAVEFFYNFGEYTRWREELSRVLVSAVEDHVMRADRALLMIARTEERLEQPSLLPGLLEAAFTSHEHFQKFIVTDETGDVLAAYPQTGESRSIPGFFRELSNPLDIGETEGAGASSAGAGVLSSRLSDPYVSPNTGDLTIRMYMKTETGRYVMGELRLSFLQQVLEQTMGAGGVSRLVFLTDRYGNIIAHPDLAYVQQQVNIGGTELIRRTKEISDPQTTVSSLQRLSGTRYFAQTHLIPSTGWIMVDAVTFPSLLSMLFRSIYFLAGMLALLLGALALYFRSFISRLVINPLVYFLHIVERSVWEDEPLSVDENISTFSEFQVLQKSFNVMTARVRQRDEELRKYLRAMQEAGFAIYITDAAGVIEYVNPAFTRITGYGGEEAKGRTPNILNSGQHGDEYFRRLWQSLLGGEVWEEEIINRRKDGATYYAHQTIAPIYDSRGEITHFVAIQTDISERYRTEMRIKESETLYRSLFRDAADSIFLVNPEDGSFLEFNDQTHITLGYSRDEFSRLKVEDIEALEDRDDVFTHMNQLRNSGYGSFETQHLTKDGEIRNVIMTVRYLEIGRRRFFLAIAHDITDRKMVEEELRRSEAKYRLLAENSTDLISQHDLNGTYTYASPASKRLLGYEPAELEGRNAYELFHPEDLKQIQESHTAIQSGEDVYNVIYRIRRKDGSYTWFETVSRTVRDTDTGEPSEILGISRDVSERKRIEEELRLSKERAEEANRIKSDFLANISHEIRTPMNSVLGYAQLLNHHLVDSRLRLYVSSIEKSGTMLLSLLNDILDMSRIEAGRLQLEYGPVQIVPLLEDIRQVFDFRAREKGLEFDLDISPEVPPVLLLDEVRLRQILLNLVGNAIKFTDAGRVRLCIDLNEDSEGEGAGQPKQPAGGRQPDQGSAVDLLISVSDTGIGIPKDQRERIFEAFRQQEGQSNRTYGGTGLGLAISRRLVEAMQGELDFRSEVGGGTTFYIDLPGVGVASGLEPAPEGEEKAGEGQLSWRFTGGTVLIADDDETGRRVTVDWLSESGLGVLEAADGSSALQEAKVHGPQLILLNSNLPDLSGEQVLERLGESAQTRDTPVILVSALTLEEIRQRFDGYELEGVLRKPIGFGDLMDRIAKLLPGELSAETRRRPTEETYRRDSLAEPLALAQSLEERLLPRWRSIRSTMIVDDLQDFAEELAQLAEAHGHRGLADYARSLLDAAERFDVELLSRLTEEFGTRAGEMIEQLRGGG